MAEYSSPLLSSSNSPESDTHRVEKHILTSLDDTIEQCIGNFGWAQFLQAVLISFAWVFDAQQTFISVFTDAEPKWHCTEPDTAESCNSFIPTNPCTLPRSSWTRTEPLKTSIISEWDLSCSGPILSGLPASFFFMGCLVGGLVLATLADSSLGRKNMLFLSCLTMSITGALTALSPNIWVYSGLRFLSGFARATIGTCALVLSSEIVCKRWRGEVGIIGFLCFTLGFLSLPAMAYLNRESSWRNLYLFTSIPGIFYSFLFKSFVHESPRWLFIKGRKEEAIQTLKSIASIKENSLNICSSSINFEQETWNVDLYSAIKILWEKKWAFRRLTSVMIIGFGIGMTYYGMPLGVGNFGVNLYLSVTFNALSELPASLVTFFLIGRLNRRSVLLGFCMVSGFCSVMSVVVAGGDRRWVELVPELVAFFSACTAFNVLLIYMLELFPTCVRNSALSMVRQTLVFGGVFSPVLVAAGRKNGFWSYGVFGLMIGCCGLFVIFLPETRGRSICDTMDEQEYKENCGVTSSV